MKKRCRTTSGIFPLAASSFFLFQAMNKNCCIGCCMMQVKGGAIMKEMAELAERAVEAAKFWGMDLDYSALGLEDLEKLAGMIFRLNRNQPLPEEILLSVASLYGAYLGEVLLRSGLKDLGFAWTENGEGETGIGREDIWMAPVTKVYKRITQGADHDLTNFFEVMFGLAIGAIDLNDPRMHILSEEAV